ncbi:MAG: hypothetical protein QOF89_1252 [Acidobacteriota bacterium]|jgi:GNAT superfamily N-acetyltransferase|nr:hypothetical protein [Acidobacteriota bacterium]
MDNPEILDPLVREAVSAIDATVREARAGDREFVLAAVERLAGFPLPPWRTPPEVVAGDARTLRRFLDSGQAGSTLLVAETAEGSPLGFVFLETEKDYFTQTRHGHIGIVAVTQEAEGKGVGRVLMRAAEAWAREQGFAKLTLSVFENNHHARRVYEHVGYSPETLRYVKIL